jgi:hypothetical protein
MRHDPREIGAWDALFHRGHMSLTRSQFDYIFPNLSERAQVILRDTLDDLERQTKWIAEARAELVGETARIREIGIVMAKAGLRSYTDKEGRIYVADKETRK